MTNHWHLMQEKYEWMEISSETAVTDTIMLKLSLTVDYKE